MMRVDFRELWRNYRSEVFFFLCLSSLTVLGHWLSWYIPVDLFENELLLIEHGASSAICLAGAWLMFRHSDGMRIRRVCAYALVLWGLSEVWFLVQTCVLRQSVLCAGSDNLTVYMLFAGNFLGWLLLVYPTETLRPGWLTWKITLSQLVPMAALCVLDRFVQFDLRWIISLFPLTLFVLVLTHIRAYRIWCENNYSSMEHIDVQWIVRYLIMLFVIGASYGYMMVSANPCRAFTQNLLIQFLFVYSISEILFRRDPWEGIEPSVVSNQPSDDSESLCQSEERSVCDNGLLLEQWMHDSKPYLNPDLKLIDLRAVLPMNRTYLSQFINDTYGCTFYQFVNRYRVEEAKRLMQEHPDWRMSDVAERSGFSSPAALSHIFSKETGITPREWCKKN